MRLYEASRCGSIPVVVGSKEEIEVEFKYEENPPWLFFDNWEDACKGCLNLLLESKDNLQEIQDKILLWWENRINNLNTIISNELMKIMDERKSLQNHNVLFDENKLKNFPPVNFISIEESEDRRKILYKNFEKYGITQITPHIYKKYNVDDDKVVGTDVDILMPKKHRGPVTSHLKSIKKWYETTNDEYAFFCEDDLSFESIKYWNFTWENFFNRLPKNWQSVQLSFICTSKQYIDRRFSNCEDIFRERDWCDWSACAYLIKRSHAKNIVNNYFNGDQIILEYKGYDWYKRLEFDYRWMIPCSETMVYTNFYEETNYVIPLFLESLDFSSTWTTDKYDEEESIHNFSHNMILNWWKNNGKNLTLDQIFQFK
jgi:GR25 family glycosyltransferase involved in LPS biosynthesis